MASVESKDIEGEGGASASKRTDHLTHFDTSGQAHMVDVAAKPDTKRIAQACGAIVMQPATFDLIATGGTAEATAKLAHSLGAEIAGLGFVVELDFLNGRDKLKEYDVFSLLHYGE